MVEEDNSAAAREKRVQVKERVRRDRHKERSRWLARLHDGSPIARTAVRMDEETLLRAADTIRSGAAAGIRLLELLPLTPLPLLGQEALLQSLSGATGLEQLSLFRCELPLSAVRVLAEVLASGAMPHLRTLELGDCELTDDGFCALLDALSQPASSSGKSLEELHLFRNGITDACVPALLRTAVHLPRLEEVNLCWCELDDAGAQALVEGLFGDPRCSVSRLRICCNLSVGIEVIPSLWRVMEDARVTRGKETWIDLVEEFEYETKGFNASFRPDGGADGNDADEK